MAETRAREEGWWVEHQGLRFQVQDDGFPIERGEGLDADKFKARIIDPDGLLEDFFNHKDAVVLRRDGVEEISGLAMTIEWDQDEGITLVKCRDWWHQVWERATRDEEFKSVDMSTVVRRALGLLFNVREPFSNDDNITELVDLEVASGRLQVEKEGGDFKTGTTFQATSKNLGREGATVDAVTLEATDRVGADPVEVFEDLDDNSKSDEAEQTAFYDTVLELIRLHSDPVTRTFPFDDLSQTESMTGRAHISKGKLSIETEEIFGEDFETQDMGSFESRPAPISDTTDFEGGALSGEVDVCAASIGPDRFLIYPRSDPDIPEVVHTDSPGVDWDEPSIDELSVFGYLEDLRRQTTSQSIGSPGWSKIQNAFAESVIHNDGRSNKRVRYGGDLANTARFTARFTPMDGVEDGDIIASIRREDTTTTGEADVWIGVFWRAEVETQTSTGVAVKNGYALSLRHNSEIHLLRFDGGSVTTIATFSGTFDLNDWYLLRLKIDGDRHRLKWWKDSDPEPGSWNFDVTDSNHKESHWGLGFFHDDPGVQRRISPLSMSEWMDYALWDIARIKKEAGTSSEPIVVTKADGSLSILEKDVDGFWVESLTSDGLPADREDESLVQMPDGEDVMFIATLGTADRLVVQAYTHNGSEWARETQYEGGFPDWTDMDNLTGVFIDNLTRDALNNPRWFVVKRENSGGWNTMILWWTGEGWARDTDFEGLYGGSPNTRSTTLAHGSSHYAIRPTTTDVEVKALENISDHPPNLDIEAVGGTGENWSGRTRLAKSAVGLFDPNRFGRLDCVVQPTNGKTTYITIGPDTYTLRVLGDGTVQRRIANGAYSDLPTTRSMLQDEWNTLILMWDNNGSDPANWECEVFVGGGSGGKIGTYKSTNQDIGEVRIGHYADRDASWDEIDAHFDNFLVHAGHDLGELTGQWISKNITDPNEHHGFEFTPTETLPGSSTIKWSHSRDDGATWTEIDAADYGSVITVNKTSKKTKLKAELTAPDSGNIPFADSIVEDRHYKYATGEVKWQSISLGNDFKPRKMRVKLIDANGDPAKALPSGASIAIDVTPDNFGNVQTISDGGEATFDPSLLGAADWRVRFRLDTTEAHNTPEVQSFQLEAEPDGTDQVVTYHISRDGSTFHEVTPGTKFSGFGAGEDPKDQLVWRVKMENQDAGSTPHVDELTIAAETTSDLKNVRAGTITDWGVINSLKSTVELNGDLLQRVVDITGILPKRTYDPATGEVVVDWNAAGAGGSVLEVDPAKVKGLRTKRSVEAQATRVVYTGGEET